MPGRVDSEGGRELETNSDSRSRSATGTYGGAKGGSRSHLPGGT